MKAQHIPGPWSQEYDGSLCMAGQVVAQPHNLAPDTADPEEQRANARLIAAAPELLAACENLENDDGSIPEHAWRIVQDAIAKARGES